MGNAVSGLYIVQPDSWETGRCEIRNGAELEWGEGPDFLFSTLSDRSRSPPAFLSSVAHRNAESRSRDPVVGMGWPAHMDRVDGR